MFDRRFSVVSNYAIAVLLFLNLILIQDVSLAQGFYSMKGKGTSSKEIYRLGFASLCMILRLATI